MQASHISLKRTFSALPNRENLKEKIDEGAEYSVRDESGVELRPNAEGSFSLSATESYICAVNATGYLEMEIEISVSDEAADWSFDGNEALLTVEAPELHIGDLDDDGAVTMLDAQALFDYLAGNIEPDEDGLAYDDGGSVAFNLAVADINGGGKVGADDILPMLDLVAAQAGN